MVVDIPVDETVKQKLRGDTGARELLAGPRTRRVEVGHLAEAADVDTPDHLESLRT